MHAISRPIWSRHFEVRCIQKGQHSWKASPISTRNVVTSASVSHSGHPDYLSMSSTVRGLLIGVGVSVVCLSLNITAANASDPYEDANNIVYGPTPEGYGLMLGMDLMQSCGRSNPRWSNYVSRNIRACPSNVNPNCVSTGSANEGYSPAWRATEKTAAGATKVNDNHTHPQCCLTRSMSQ
jgi:hypothetical protein